MAKQFKFDHAWQLVIVDDGYQHVDEHIYAARQPEYALDVRNLGFCLIRVVKHDLA